MRQERNTNPQLFPIPVRATPQSGKKKTKKKQRFLNPISLSSTMVSMALRIKQGSAPLVRRGDPSPTTEAPSHRHNCVIPPPRQEKLLRCGYFLYDVRIGTCRRGSKRTGGRQCGYAL